MRTKYLRDLLCPSMKGGGFHKNPIYGLSHYLTMGPPIPYTDIFKTLYHSPGQNFMHLSQVSYTLYDNTSGNVYS